MRVFILSFLFVTFFTHYQHSTYVLYFLSNLDGAIVNLFKTQFFSKLSCFKKKNFQIFKFFSMKGICKLDLISNLKFLIYLFIFFFVQFTDLYGILYLVHVGVLQKNKKLKKKMVFSELLY